MMIPGVVVASEFLATMRLSVGVRTSARWLKLNRYACDAGRFVARKVSCGLSQHQIVRA
jgi:hypothetical protein